ncbi:N-6 DNA Methylase [Phycisphaerae bacterium RAS2]|nr:N-6 DNA Methylase [Phycisphaerae bacterium RAS2]
MPPLATSLRNDLETVVKKARVIAERGAKSALESLTVHEAKSGGHLDAAGRELRARLRAHGKQLGDARKPNGEQAIGRLIRECAYEHWHRMLFARFLAENDLLIHPEHNVSVSLDDVLELAREQGIDQWELASRFAQRMLPQIFRPDDPVLAVALPRERTLELEQLLESLPTETFKADDSLGWVYQFWQAEEKDRVNASGEKITGETLPAVTQLFTEHYMVLFLLHNTLGAWWAGKRIANGEERIANAATEADARAAVALPDYPFEYLRFVREPREGDEDGKPTGPWRPAAGAFDGWPRAAKDLKVLDPCCGSGHFLVAAFDLLVRVRVTDERVSLDEAIHGVLSENLYGLELDARCTQIAAFNLAFAAWRLIGKPLALPVLHIACSGLGPNATEEDWLRLAEQSGNRMPTLGRDAIRNGLLNLHALFSKAPTIGSLIDPEQLPSDLIAADYDTLRPFLDDVFKAESADVDNYERAVAAKGMAKAAEILVGPPSGYTLSITNVPFLTRSKQCPALVQWGEDNAADATSDLATVFLSRIIEVLGVGGTAAIVTPQNWYFLSTYKRLRERLLRTCRLDFLVRLGPNAFRDMNWWAATTALSVFSRGTPEADNSFAGLDTSDWKQIEDKQRVLLGSLGSAPVLVDQRSRFDVPDARFTFDEPQSEELLEVYASSLQGVSTADLPRFCCQFWEATTLPNGWTYFQSSSHETLPYSGREQILNLGVLERESDDLGAALRGRPAWGRRGVAIRQMRHLPATLYEGDPFDTNVAVVVPKKAEHLDAVWAYCTSPEYLKEVRSLDQKTNVTNATLTKVPFDEDRWRRTAQERYPTGLPQPESDDSTQWLFHGRPEESTAPLQVALVRLLGYRWPAELDEKMHLSTRARDLVQRCAELASFADADGIVCIPPVRGERPAADRLAALLAACGIRPDRELDAWLREEFFAEHCKLFYDRPFIWHIWDGRKDGFHALVNYHKLVAPGDAGRRLLTALTHSYLGDWIRDQKDQVGDGKPGAEARLAAALELKAELEKVLSGEPPFDIFVRWKPLREQPIGWEPDINDGVRLNIRPFLMAKDVGRKGAGVLRCKPNIKWDKDRGKEPQSLRPKADFPWFWGCDPEKLPAHQKDFSGGDTFDGNRWNELHYTNAFKQAARDAVEGAKRG